MCFLFSWLQQKTSKMPRKSKYDSFEIKIEPATNEEAKNPLEIEETWIKVEDMKEEKFEEAPFHIESDISDDSSSSIPETSNLVPESNQNPKKKIFTLNNKTECPLCGLKFGRKSNMNRHMQNRHPEAVTLSFACKFCDKSFINRAGLNKHTSLIHPTELSKTEELSTEQFICDYDGRVFKFCHELKGHMQIHMTYKLEKVKCDICQIEIQHRYLNRHKQEVHTDKIFQCDICSFCCKTARSLKIHKKGHNPEFQCQICNKAFAINSKLKVHVKKVHDKSQGNCVCDVCGKTFAKKAHLDCHKKSHIEKQKNFKCDKCPMTFYINSALNKHKMTHERKDAKVALMKDPVKCEVCSSYLSNKKILSTHMRKVHQVQNKVKKN